MKKLLLFLCVALMSAHAAVGKEIPGGSDIAIVSDEEIAAARDARRAENFAPTTLLRPLEVQERNAKATEAAKLGEQAPLALISVNRALLALPTERVVGADTPAQGWGVPRQLSRLSLTLEGVEYVLGVVDESADRKRGLRQVTAAVLNQADGAARFTIDDREGLLAGTLRSGERAYRIVSIDRDAQAVYALADSTSALRKSMSNAAAAASSLEKRHVQLEVLSQITPSRVRMARNDLSLSIEGGDLGSLNTVTARSVLRVLQQLQPLTNASGSEKIRIVNTEAGRIRFEQLVNDIPVVRRNELIINGSGKILRIRSSIVDSSWAPTGEILATDKASDIALQTLARRLKTKRTAISVSAPPRLSYAVDGPNRALIPRYAFSLQHESGRTYEITVHAIAGEAAVDTAGSQALGDDFLTYVYKRISGSPTSGGGFETELIWRETTGGGQVCPWAGGPGSYRCTSYADAQLVFTTANELSRNWESITAADPINRCCEILGYGDVVSIILDTPAAINGASFNTTSKAILFGPTGPTNMAYITDVLIHEFMHAYFFDYNFETTRRTTLAGL